MTKKSRQGQDDPQDQETRKSSAKAEDQVKDCGRTGRGQSAEFDAARVPNLTRQEVGLDAT